MLSILLPFALSHLLFAAPTPPPEEVRYLQARDAYIRQLSANPKNATEMDQRARAKLEVQLRQVIGPALVPGFTALGKLNLESLIKDEPGFGQVDGLMFVNGNERLFITTPYLFTQAIKGSGGVRDTDAFDSNEFYSKVFSWDVAYTILADVPYREGSLTDLAVGKLALTAQDIGAFPAKDLVVVALREGRIYIMNVDLPAPGLQIPMCASLWRKISDKSSSPEQGDKAFAAYQSCWKANAKNQAFFPALQDRVTEIAKRLR